MMYDLIKSTSNRNDRQGKCACHINNAEGKKFYRLNFPPTRNYHKS